MDKQELERELAHKTEELNQIKEVLAIFLDKVYSEVDNITPEDLESKLRDNEMDKYRQILANCPDIESKLYAAWVKEIVTLCQTLEWKEFAGYSDLQNIKLFIKSLARENYTLKQMIGDKQTNADPRTNNLGSSSTTTN